MRAADPTLDRPSRLALNRAVSTAANCMTQTIGVRPMPLSLA